MPAAVPEIPNDYEVSSQLNILDGLTRSQGPEGGMFSALVQAVDHVHHFTNCKGSVVNMSNY
jgi:hypothetical protein